MPEKYYIGTSGFYYDHWQGRFYPEDLAKKEWFGYYQKHFDTVELNNTFYHLPEESAVKSWNDNSGSEFIFAVKASRFITHIKLLKDPEEPLERFFNVMRPLKKKTGPVLFQLPGRFKKDTGRLKGFLKSLEKYSVMKVFEFRNSTWWNDDVFEALKENNACFCWYDMAGDKPPQVKTADFLYVRMHGGQALYRSKYTEGELEKLAKNIYNIKVKGVYIYFNNDYNAYAVENALKLREVIYERR